jgi:cytochrome c oxidase cbb3-type subunit III
MAVDHQPDRDGLTGYLTTGHEWNGIKELNTPVPRAVYFFLSLAFVFSLGYWVLMPAWPLGVTYTRGLLGVDQRNILAATLKEAAGDRDAWAKKIASEDYAAIQSDPHLMTVVRETGHALFGNNCAACHGIDAKGGPGFPNLTTSSWLWGGKPDDIFNTIRVGINSAHPDTHVSQMPAFGHDQMLPRPDILKVIAYVYSLSDPNAKDLDPKRIEAGKAIFTANCVACHGDDAKGNPELGAPDLTDRFWIYGGDLETIDTTVWGGRQGHMPTWESRLSALDRKILTLYLLDKRTAAP